MTAERAAVVRRMTIWGVALAAVGGVISWVMGDAALALGVALGALVGLLNITLLAGAVTSVLADPDRHRPPPASKWALPGVLLVKWPLVLLALAGILWYMPARPEGVAVGVILSLVAAAAAARPRENG